MNIKLKEIKKTIPDKKNRVKKTAIFKPLEEAKEALFKLNFLKQYLTPQDEETLEILMDKKIMARLEKSLIEAKNGQFEPLSNILK